MSKSTNSARRNKHLFRAGIIGTAIAAVCCFTPALVILLGTVGLSAALAWLDYVLLPALALFIGITNNALIRRRGRPAEEK
jgi:mercuric ion transport protein